MRESNFSFVSQNRACVCITSQLYDRRALDTTSSLPLLNSLTHLTYLTSTSPRIREILTMDGGLERLVRILRQYCSTPPQPQTAPYVYSLMPSNFNPNEQRPGMALVAASSSPAVDKARTYLFSLAFQCVVNVGVRGSEAIRSRVVQAGMLDVVAGVLEAWLKSKGFALGPSTTGSGVPRETREQRNARRALQQQERDRLQAQQLTAALQATMGNDPALGRPDRQLSAEQMGRLFNGGRLDNIYARTSDVRTTQQITQHANNDETMGGGSGSERTSGDEGGNDADGDGDDDMDVDAPSSHTHISNTTPPHAPRFGASLTLHPVRPRPSTHSSASTETSTENTPVRSSTPTASVVVSGRDRSGTIIGRRTWDGPAVVDRERRRRDRRGVAPDEDEDEEAIEVDDAEEEAIRPHRRAVGIVDGGEGAMDMMLSPGMDIRGAGVGQGLVALEPNDDLAMGAPPGAPGANTEPTITMPLGPGAGPMSPRGVLDEMTPRAPLLNLPETALAGAMIHTPQAALAGLGGLIRDGTVQRTLDSLNRTRTIGADGKEEVPKYRDDDVLIALQLLAYLSKYPHVRQAFYRPRDPFYPIPPTEEPKVQEGIEEVEVATVSDTEPRPRRELRPARTETPPTVQPVAGAVPVPSGSASVPPGPSPNPVPAPPPAPVFVPNMTHLPTRPALSTASNVFSLVERFTFRPSPSDPLLPMLPKDIQYWAGVIMRNACRKDESRGGIRMCANMTCGKWEEFPREFAKCRRCRKAKYCGKDCQSKAWAEGHRFWCNAREEGAENQAAAAGGSGGDGGGGDGNGGGGGGGEGGGGGAPPGPGNGGAGGDGAAAPPTRPRVMNPATAFLHGFIVRPGAPFATPRQGDARGHAHVHAHPHPHPPHPQPHPPHPTNQQVPHARAAEYVAASPDPRRLTFATGPSNFPPHPGPGETSRFSFAMQHAPRANATVADPRTDRLAQTTGLHRATQPFPPPPPSRPRY